MKPKEIRSLSEKLLTLSPDPIPKYLIEHELVGEHKHHDKRELYATKKIRQLVESQLDDGSWGRFHTQDTKNKTAFSTSELAIKKATIWGLDKTDPVIKHAIQYMEDVLTGKRDYHDWKEKNPTWPIGVETWTAATLALVDPDNPLLETTWGKCFHVAQSAFATGAFDLTGLEQGHRDVAIYYKHRGYDGKLAYGSYYFISNIYALKILATRAERIPPRLAEAMVSWMWTKPDGMAYTSETQLSEYAKRMSFREIEMRLGIIEDLIRFRCDRRRFQRFLDWLDQQRETDLWDFGALRHGVVTVPLSSSWRKRLARPIDYTVAILRFQKTYHRWV